MERRQLQVLPELAEPETGAAQHQDGEVIPRPMGPEGVEKLARDEGEERRQEEGRVHLSGGLPPPKREPWGCPLRTLGGFPATACRRPVERACRLPADSGIPADDDYWATRARVPAPVAARLMLPAAWPGQP